MNRAFLTFCILAAQSVLLAMPLAAASLQDRFDIIAKRDSFGEAEVDALRAIIAEEKESGEKVDCTFCPDAFTWYLAEKDLFQEAVWLFEHNADYGIKSKNDGMTLLHAVCRDGHQDFVAILIQRGAEVNLPDKEGRTAIHYAVMSGNSKLVEYLLDLGSNPNLLTKKKETPLHFAAKYSGLETVQFLIEHGARIKAINWALVNDLIEQSLRQHSLDDESSISALKNALGLKTPEALQAVDEDEDDEDEDEDSGGERYADTIEELPSGPNGSEHRQLITHIDQIPVDLLPLDKKDAANTDGMTALHFAAQNGNTEVVKYLIENGADIEAQDTILSRSPMHLAAENGNLDCVKYLAEQGADLLDKDSYGATALHYAAKNNRLDIIKYLVSKKMDYTAKDVRGWTAMHYAACGGSIEIVRYLLAKGLNINERTQTGRTPLFFVTKEHRDLRVFMVSQGAK